jgi:16S rRNA (cytosine1402-N4)-methyltransferase
MQDGPLDMRMSGEGISAADVVNGAPADELARIFREYGEERFAGRIARAIVTDRELRPFTRTLELAGLIARVAPSRERHKHPATRVFQALRIHVNRELAELESALEAARTRLAPAGRLAVISFHSLEDRIVKLRFREDERVRVITRKPIVPSDEEVVANPRARSAKLRIAEIESENAA